jgi:hypothetical protein
LFRRRRHSKYESETDASSRSSLKQFQSPSSCNGFSNKITNQTEIELEAGGSNFCFSFEKCSLWSKGSTDKTYS